MSSKENNTQRVPEEIKKDDIGYSERFHDPPIGDGKMGEAPPLSKSAPTGGSWDDYMDKSSSKSHRRSGSSDMKKNQIPGEPMMKRHLRERGDRNGGNYYTDDLYTRGDPEHPLPPMHHPMFRVEHLTHQDVQGILMENYNLRRDIDEMQHQFRAERSDLLRRLKHTMSRLHYLEDRKLDIPEYNEMGKPFPPPLRKGYRSSRSQPLGPPPPLNRPPLGAKDSSESYNIQPPQESYKESRATGNDQHYAPESPEPITHADLKNSNSSNNGRKEDMKRRSFSEDKPMHESYRYGRPYYDMSPQDRFTDYDPELMYGPRKMYPYSPYDQDEFYDEENYSSEEDYPKRQMRGPPMHSLPPMSMSMMPPPPPPPIPPMGYPPQQQGGWMMDDMPYGDPRGQMMPPPPPPPPGSIHRSSSKRSQLSRHSSKRNPMTAEEEENIMLQQQEQPFGEEDDAEMQMLMQQMSLGQPPMGRYPPMMRAEMYMMGGNRMPPPPPPLPPGPPPGPPGPPMIENLMYDDFPPSGIRRVPSHRSVPGGSARSSYLGSR